MARLFWRKQRSAASFQGEFLHMAEASRQLDARGLRCPMPLLKLKQALHGMAPGEAVDVLTSDPGSVRDFQAFLRQSGHELLELREGDADFFFRIRKKPAA